MGEASRLSHGNAPVTFTPSPSRLSGLLGTSSFDRTAAQLELEVFSSTSLPTA